MTLKKYISLYGIDVSHFTGRPIKSKPRVDMKKLDAVLVQNSWVSRGSIKSRMINANLLDTKCAVCGISSWLDKALTLQLDHINGISSDNRAENLRLLCPNCHSQTDTYCGRNKIRYPKPTKPEKVQKEPKPTKPPTDPNWRHNPRLGARKPRPNTRKVVRPSADELYKLVWEQPASNIAVRFGVSDSVIVKWCRAAGVKKPPRGYWTKILGITPPVPIRTASCGSFSMYRRGCRCDKCVSVVRGYYRERKRKYREKKKALVL